MSRHASPASELTARVARVAVDAVADRPERTFSYLLPPGLGETAPGSLVLVPYGRRLALGYLLGTDALQPSDAGHLKSVEAIVSEPMLTPDLLELARELSVYYRAPIGTTLAAMLPPGLESRLQRRWRILDVSSLPAGLREAVELAPDRLLDDAELLRFAPLRGGGAWLDRLRRRESIASEWRLAPPAIHPRRVRTIRRLPGERPEPRRAPLQRSMLAALDDVPVDLTQLADELGVSAASLLGPARRLVASGHVALDWRIVTRDALAHRSPVALLNELADEQRAALEAISGLAPGGELLLEGVAASGKTDVYLAAIAAAVADGGGAIVLVPEVSLVPQLGDRLSAMLGDRLTVLHSGMSAGERHDSWWRILRGEVSVVLGTRTAIFAPVRELRLIVIDEEHEAGYKSDRTPRYDARWVARRSAALRGARLVLGSATPDLVSVARVRGGHAERARLVERRVGWLPHVEVVDMRAELTSGNRSILSRSLVEALAGLGPDRGQGILLINRRGASTFVLCRDCGESLRCPDCNLPFVFHLDGDQLRCHHCGRAALVPKRCPHCGSARIRYFGAGTQRVEAEVRDRFPRLRVARLDSDALAARRAFESVYDDFRDGRTDVLVGTQLVAKGLDLPGVTLAAVIAADVTLNLPDYRAAERTFQLLAQVAGRAGRGPRPGRVIFQTYAPDHFAVRAAARLDSDAFADAELMRRRLLGYPPSGFLARLLIADPDQRRAQERGAAAAVAIRIPGVEVLGPVSAYVARRAGRWRMQVVLRSGDPATRAAALEQVPAGVAIDVDPESLL